MWVTSSVPHPEYPTLAVELEDSCWACSLPSKLANGFIAQKAWSLHRSSTRSLSIHPYFIIYQLWPTDPGGFKRMSRGHSATTRERGVVGDRWGQRGRGECWYHICGSLYYKNYVILSLIMHLNSLLLGICPPLAPIAPNGLAEEFCFSGWPPSLKRRPWKIWVCYW